MRLRRRSPSVVLAPLDPAQFDESGVVPAPDPRQTGPYLKDREEHREETRRFLSLGLLFLLALVALIGEVAFVLGYISAEEFREVSGIFTPIATLAGAAFGFFFGQESRRS